MFIFVLFFWIFGAFAFLWFFDIIENLHYNFWCENLWMLLLHTQFMPVFARRESPITTELNFHTRFYSSHRDDATAAIIVKLKHNRPFQFNHNQIYSKILFLVGLKVTSYKIIKLEQIPIIFENYRTLNIRWICKFSSL